MFKPKLEIGETSFDNVLYEILEMQQEAVSSKDPQKEYNIMFQFATRPIILHDEKTNEILPFESAMNGLTATIALEDLLAFNTTSDELRVTIKKENIEKYLMGRVYKELQDSGTINSSAIKEAVKAVPQYPDIHTGLGVEELANLYTNAQKVNAPHGKKYSKEELVNYAKLHGPKLFAELINSLQDAQTKELAMEIYFQMFHEHFQGKQEREIKQGRQQFHGDDGFEPGNSL